MGVILDFRLVVLDVVGDVSILGSVESGSLQDIFLSKPSRVFFHLSFGFAGDISSTRSSVMDEVVGVISQSLNSHFVFLLDCW